MVTRSASHLRKPSPSPTSSRPSGRVAHWRDCTQGSLLGSLLALSLPLLLCMVLLAATTLVRIAMIHSAAAPYTEEVLRATAPFMLAPWILASIFGMGCSVMVGQNLGARSGHLISDSVHTALSLACIAGLLVTVGGVLATGWFTSLGGMDPHLVSTARTVMYLAFGSAFLPFLLCMGVGILFAVGNVRTPLAATTLFCAAHASLDVLLLGHQQMGAITAASVSVIATVLASALVLHTLTQVLSPWRLHPSRLRIVAPVARDMLFCTVPWGLYLGCIALSTLQMSRTATSFGDQMSTAWTFATRVTALLFPSAAALSQATTIVSAQNFGASNHVRTRKALHAALACAIVGIGALEGALCLAARPLATVLASSDVTAIELGTTLVWLTVPFVLLLVCLDLMVATIRGSGETLRSALVTLVGLVAVGGLWQRVVVSVHHSLGALLLTNPLTWGVTIIAVMIYYRHGSWLTKSLRRARHQRARHFTEE